MARLKQDFIGGELDVALSSGDTTMESVSLGDMRVVDPGDTMAVVLDPDGIGGDPEIVWVTIHVSSATTATISRGQEGTVARAHVAGIEWIHTATAVDFDDPTVTSDHGSLSGLADDDHPQYHTDARGDARYATLAQGALADTAIQSSDLGGAAFTEPTDYATSVQGDLADSNAAEIAAYGTVVGYDVGTGTNQVILGNDARLSDDRDPNAHAATHAAGGGDEITFDPATGDNNLPDTVTTIAELVSWLDTVALGAGGAHASSHYTGAPDELTPSDIGAASLAELSSHTAATTGVHGIADTADLVVDSDLGGAAFLEVGVNSDEVAAGDAPSAAQAAAIAASVPRDLADFKGDLLAATGNNAWARVPIGVSGEVLTPNSGETGGVEWVSLASLGAGIGVTGHSSLAQLTADDHVQYPLAAELTKDFWRIKASTIALTLRTFDDDFITGAERVAASAGVSGSATMFDAPAFGTVIGGQEYVWTHEGGTGGVPIRIEVDARGELQWDTRQECAVSGVPATTSLGGAVLWAGLGPMHHDTASGRTISIGHLEDGDDGHWVAGLFSSTNATAAGGGTWTWHGEILHHNDASTPLGATYAHQTFLQCVYGTGSLDGYLVGVCTESTSTPASFNAVRFRLSIADALAWAAGGSSVDAEKWNGSTWVTGLGGLGTLIPGSDNEWLYGFQMFTAHDGVHHILAPYEEMTSSTWYMRHWYSTDDWATMVGPLDVPMQEHGGYLGVRPDYITLTGLGADKRPRVPSLSWYGVLRDDDETVWFPEPAIASAKLLPSHALPSTSGAGGNSGFRTPSGYPTAGTVAAGDHWHPGVPASAYFIFGSETQLGLDDPLSDLTMVPQEAGLWIVYANQDNPSENGAYQVADEGGGQGDYVDPGTQLPLSDAGGLYASWSAQTNYWIEDVNGTLTPLGYGRGSVVYDFGFGGFLFKNDGGITNQLRIAELESYHTPIDGVAQIAQTHIDNGTSLSATNYTEGAVTLGVDEYWLLSGDGGDTYDLYQVKSGSAFVAQTNPPSTATLITESQQLVMRDTDGSLLFPSHEGAEHLLERRYPQSNSAGTILVADGSGDYTTLDVGADGYVLKADSGEATGLIWESVSATGGAGTLTEIVQDDTPELGGQLDALGENITGAGTIDADTLTADEIVGTGSLTLQFDNISTNTPLTADHHTVFVTTDGVDITLPTAVGIAGREYTIIPGNDHENIGVLTTSSQTIGNGTGASIGITALIPNTPIKVISDGANWRVSESVSVIAPGELWDGGNYNDGDWQG